MAAVTVQLTTVRFVGTFVADDDVPGGVVAYLAEQLDVAAASMTTYTDVAMYFVRRTESEREEAFLASAVSLKPSRSRSSAIERACASRPPAIPVGRYE